MRRLGRLIVLCAALLTLAGAEEKPTSIAAAAAAVDANMKTREGKAYDEEFGKEFGGKYPAVMKDCKKKAGADTRSFDMLVRIEKDGSVVRLYRARTLHTRRDFRFFCVACTGIRLRVWRGRRTEVGWGAAQEGKLTVPSRTGLG